MNLPSGVSITDVAGNALTTTLPSSAALALQIDTTAPTVKGVAATRAAPLSVGKKISITVTTSEAVKVAGKPTLTLNDGGVATYDAAHSTATKLVFSATVLAGQNTPALGATKLNLPAGSSITDLAGNALVVKLPVGSPGPVIDTTAPTVTSVASSPSSGAISTGSVVTITLKMSEPVTVAGAPVLVLNDGGTASYDAKKSTSKSLVFDYTAPSNQGAKSLSVVGIQMASSAAIVDAAGNAADLSKAAGVRGVQAISISGKTETEIFGASSQNVTFASV